MSEFRPQIAPHHDKKIEDIANGLNEFGLSVSKQSIVSMLLDAQLREVEVKEFIKRFRELLVPGSKKARS